MARSMLLRAMLALTFIMPAHGGSRAGSGRRPRSASPAAASGEAPPPAAASSPSMATFLNRFPGFKRARLGNGDAASPSPPAAAPALQLTNAAADRDSAESASPTRGQTLARTEPTPPPEPAAAAAAQPGSTATSAVSASSQIRDKRVTKPKIGRNVFKAAWRITFPWLRTFPTVLDDTAMQQPAYLFCLYCWAYPDVKKKGDPLSLKTCAGLAIRSDNLRKHNEDECHKTCKAKWDKDHGTNTTSAQQAMFGPTVALARLVRTIIAAVFVCGSSIGSLVKRLVNLQRVNGVLIPDCYTSATADTEQGGIHSFLDAATQLLLCLQSTAMRQGLLFSVMGDGSTNVAHRELEAVAVRYPFDIRGRVLALKTRGLNGVRVKNEFFGIFPVDVSASRDLKSFDSQALLYGYDKLFVERGLGSWDEDEPGPGDADVLVRTAALPYVPVPGVSGLRSVAHSEASTAPQSAPNLEASRTRVLPLAPGWHLV